MDVDSELDRLYATPPAAFVAERNHLAQALRKAGDKRAADDVAHLPRPSVVAWAINLVHFRDRELLDALRKAGAALRKAQESADMEQFASRKRAHEDALAAVVDRASALAAGSGQSIAGAMKHRLEMTLTVLSTAADEASPPPGRMSAELEPLGFDAFTAMPAAPAPKPAKREKSPAEAARAEKIDAVKEALDAADKEVRRLERESERSQAALERAEQDVLDAERRADAARRERDDARRAAEEARQRVDAARHALASAERELEDLSARR